jgi:hypothetical protein
MMGEVVGRAVSICKRHDCLPAAVYHEHWDEMDGLLRLPGKAHRKTVNSAMIIPADALDEAGPYGVPPGLMPSKLPGIVIDDSDAKKTGKWVEGAGLKGYVKWGYAYSGAATASAEFVATMTESARFAVNVAWQPHANRTKAGKITVESASGTQALIVNMTEPPAANSTFRKIGEVDIKKGATCTVTIAGTGAGGNLHIDAVQFVKVD